MNTLGTILDKTNCYPLYFLDTNSVIKLRSTNREINLLVCKLFSDLKLPSLNEIGNVINTFLFNIVETLQPDLNRLIEITSTITDENERYQLIPSIALQSNLEIASKTQEYILKEISFNCLKGIFLNLSPSHSIKIIAYVHSIISKSAKPFDYQNNMGEGNFIEQQVCNFTLFLFKDLQCMNCKVFDFTVEELCIGNKFLASSEGREFIEFTKIISSFSVKLIENFITSYMTPIQENRITNFLDGLDIVEPSNAISVDDWSEDKPSNPNKKRKRED